MYINPPIHNQTNNLSQFSFGSENINIKQVTIPAIGTNGKRGALNGLSALGCVFLIIKTAEQTITNANKVPMLTSSAKILSGRKLARIATKIPVRMVDFHGVRNFLCTAPKILGGSKPSRAIAKNILG